MPKIDKSWYAICWEVPFCPACDWAAYEAWWASGDREEEQEQLIRLAHARAHPDRYPTITFADEPMTYRNPAPIEPTEPQPKPLDLERFTPGRVFGTMAAGFLAIVGLLTLEFGTQVLGCAALFVIFLVLVAFIPQ
jgi:hypothetical protein